MSSGSSSGTRRTTYSNGLPYRAAKTCCKHPLNGVTVSGKCFLVRRMFISVILPAGRVGTPNHLVWFSYLTSMETMCRRTAHRRPTDNAGREKKNSRVENLPAKQDAGRKEGRKEGRNRAAHLRRNARARRRSSLRALMSSGSLAIPTMSRQGCLPTGEP